MNFPARRRRVDVAGLAAAVDAALELPDPYPDDVAAGLPADAVAARLAHATGAAGVVLWAWDDEDARLVPAGRCDAVEPGDPPPPVDAALPDGRLVVTGRAGGRVSLVLVLVPHGTPYRERDLAELRPVADMVARALASRARVAAASLIERRLLTEVNHELRTPLAVISSGWQTLADHADRLPADARRVLVDSGLRATRTLSHLVEDLLLSARLRHEPAEATPAPVLLRPLVTRTARALGVEDRLRASVPSGLAAYADRSHLGTVLRHLLATAEEVTARDADDTVLLTVVSAGPPPDPLGLRLAHRLTEAMNGELRVAADAATLRLPAPTIDLTRAETLTGRRSSPAPG